MKSPGSVHRSRAKALKPAPAELSATTRVTVVSDNDAGIRLLDTLERVAQEIAIPLEREEDTA